MADRLFERRHTDYLICHIENTTCERCRREERGVGEKICSVTGEFKRSGSSRSGILRRKSTPEWQLFRERYAGEKSLQRKAENNSCSGDKVRHTLTFHISTTSAMSTTTHTPFTIEAEESLQAIYYSIGQSAASIIINLLIVIWLKMVFKQELIYRILMVESATNLVGQIGFWSCGPVSSERLPITRPFA